MLARGKKILLISLALALTFSFWGCMEADELSQEEIDRLVARTIDAYPEVTTARFDMGTTMTLEVVGGTDPGKMTMTINGSGAIDLADREMQMTMDMTMNIPGLFNEDMAADYYLVDDWMYVGLETPDGGREWVKMMVTDEVWQEQLQTTQIEQQIEFLKTAASVSYLGSETVNGVDCYVFEVVPDMAELLGLLSEQEETTGMDLSELSDLGNLFPEVSLKMWIARDSYQVMQAELHMLAEMLPGDFGTTEEDFTRMTLSMDVTMSLYDYDEPVTITVPPEALGAVAA